MLEKGFLSENSRRKTTKSRNSSLIGKLMVFIGAIVMVVALVYILMNLKEVDGVAKTWLPFVIGGAVLAFFGVVVMRMKKR